MTDADYDLKHNELLLEELRNITVDYYGSLSLVKRRGLRIIFGYHQTLYDVIQILFEKYIDIDEYNDLEFFFDMLRNEKLVWLTGAVRDDNDPLSKITLWDAVLRYAFLDFFEFIKLKYDKNPDS